MTAYPTGTYTINEHTPHKGKRAYTTMTEEEARAIMKEKGWSYKERSPFKAKYVYAKRRQGVRMLEVYICPLSKLDQLTEDELVAKLTTEPTKETSSESREPEVPDTTSPPTNTDDK